MHKAVFLDRDGVVNKSQVINGLPVAPKTFKDFEILDGVDWAICELKKYNWLVFIITNQPDISRGKILLNQVDSMHKFLMNNLPIDEIRVCSHDDSAKCSCRKPAPGMILDLQKKYSIDLGSSFLVGDRWRDISAGNVVGCRTIFIDHGYNEKQPEYHTHKVSNLVEATKWILKNGKN